MSCSKKGKPYGKDVIQGTLRCERRYCGEEECFCTETCTGTGSNETCVHHCSSCSVYKDWCMYDHWTWPIVKSASTNGPSTETPHWPSLQPEGVDQRLEQVQEYDVTLESEPPDSKRCIFHPGSYEEVKKYLHGEWWLVKTNAGFGYCEPIKLLTAEG